MLMPSSSSAARALVETMVETESGKTDDRPKLMAALDLARKHKGPVIVAKLDRLSRVSIRNSDGPSLGITALAFRP